MKRLAETSAEDLQKNMYKHEEESAKVDTESHIAPMDVLLKRKIVKIKRFINETRKVEEKEGNGVFVLSSLPASASPAKPSPTKQAAVQAQSPAKKEDAPMLVVESAKKEVPVIDVPVAEPEKKEETKPGLFFAVTE